MSVLFILCADHADQISGYPAIPVHLGLSLLPFAYHQCIDQISVLIKFYDFTFFFLIFSYHLGYKCAVSTEHHLGCNRWNRLGFPIWEVVWCNSELLGRELVYHWWDRLRNDSAIHIAQSLLRCLSQCGRQSREWVGETRQLVSCLVLLQRPLQTAEYLPELFRDETLSDQEYDRGSR